MRDWLKVELQSDGATCTLNLIGALSGTSIAALEAQVDQLGATPWKDVIIDVRLLKAIDAVGANVLVGLNHYIIARGGRLTVVGARGDVATTLRGCELIATVLHVEPLHVEPLHVEPGLEAMNVESSLEVMNPAPNAKSSTDTGTPDGPITVA